MDWLIVVALVLFGACFGSFAGAMVWRLRARQLQQDKKHGEKVDAKEYKKLKPIIQRVKSDRSKCLHCGHTLHWYDLVPVISWLSLGGRCRYCRKPIGWLEITAELGMVAFFVLSYLFWPYPLDDPLNVAHFILWLVAGVIMLILLFYDAKWFLLPDSMNVALAVVGAGVVAVMAVSSGDVMGTIINAAGSVGVLAGIYLVLHLVSSGRWVGFGDVKLGVGLGLILVYWELSLLALFLANLLGCLFVIPLLVAGKLKRQSRVPFGPFLIGGVMVAQLFGFVFIDWFLNFVIL